MTQTTTTLHVNGRDVAVDATPDTPLLYVLRNDLQLKGAKFGCGLGQCGACTVLIDGRAAQSCDTPLWSAQGKRVVTIEAAAQEQDDTREVRALQAAFLHEQAGQCGYCTTGMVMAAAALLRHRPSPTRPDIDAALARNLCRCGSHNRILRAIDRAAAQLAADGAAR
jgi:nicotinate dehydrogenase subunit A